MAFGGVIKLQGETEYRKALKKIQDSLKVTGSELTRIAAQYDRNDSSITRLSEKNKVLTDRLNLQKTALSDTKTMLDKAKKAYDDSKTSVSKWEDELEKARSALDKAKNSTDASADEIEDLEKQVKKCEDSLKEANTQTEKAETAVKKWTDETNKAETQVIRTRNEISRNNTELDDLRRTTDKTSDSTDDLTGSLKNNKEELGKVSEGADMVNGAYDRVNTTVGKIVSTAARAAAALAGVAAAGITAYTTSAIDSYGEYEQVVGGVDTLFGTGANKVKDNAARAYKTAGVSANEYMQQATGFSAALIQGLSGDVVTAADIADIAIKDMSDNANKFGTDISSIQTAYQDFAKDNYTLLDNLKLGYGGSQAEMARLINDTQILGENIRVDEKTVKDVPFDKIILAIHQVQEEMGITGTTAAEAADTIEGSTGSMKAAWENLKVGLADGTQDTDELIDEFVDSFMTAAENLVPRIVETVPRAVKGFGQLIEKAKPEIKKGIEKLKPTVKRSVDDLLTTIGTRFPTLEKLLRKGGDIIGAMIKKIPDLMKLCDRLLPVVAGIGAAFVAWNIVSKIGTVIAAVGKLKTAIELAGGAMKLLSAANPLGAIAVGAAAVVGAVAAIAVAWEKAGDDIKSETDIIIEQQNALQTELKNTYDERSELIGETDKSAEAIAVEYDNVEMLWNELESLADSTGRVKDKDKEHAQYILDELNSALGTEYEMTGNLISNYSSMKSSIEDVIEQKRALALLDNAQQNQATWIDQQTEATEGIGTAKAQIADAQARWSEARDEVKRIEDELAAMEARGEKGSTDYTILKGSKLETARQNVRNIQDELDEYNQTLEQQQALYYQATEELEKIGEAEHAIYEQRYDDAEAILTANLNTEAATLRNTQETEEKRRQAWQDSLDKVKTTVTQASEAYKRGNTIAAQDQINRMVTTLEELHTLAVEGGIEDGKAYVGQWRDIFQEMTETGFDISELVPWAKECGYDIGDIFGDNWESVVQSQLDKGFDVTELLKWAASSGTDLGNMSGAEFAARFGSAIDLGIPGIDTSAMLEWAERTGRTMGDLLGMSAVQAASLYNYSIDANGDGLSDLVGGGVKINGASDAAYYGSSDRWEIRNGFAYAKNAKGSIVTKPTFSLIGEEGAEAIIPLENNTEWIGKVASQLGGLLKPSAMMTGNSAVTGLSSETDSRSMISAFKAALSEMKIEMDDREMGRFVDRTVSETLYT